MNAKTTLIIAICFLNFACSESRLGAAPETIGPSGADGLSSLIATSVEPIGDNCGFGGTRISSGLDDDGDKVLGETEIDSIAFVCNGQPGDAGGPPGEIGPPGAGGLQGETGEQGPAGIAGLDGFSTITTSLSEPAGPNCEDGGIRLEVGLDINSDGILGLTEVASVSFVCNGANGTPGIQGQPGASGSMALIESSVEPAGVNCETSGTRFEIGTDLNQDGVLNLIEVSGVTFVCNGTNGLNGDTGLTGDTGPQGEQGPVGETGPQGEQGQLGLSGVNSLINSTIELPGANCEYGGTRLEVGIDLNQDGSLGITEITDVAFACNGIPGSSGIAGTQGQPGTPGVNCFDYTGDANGDGSLTAADCVTSTTVDSTYVNGDTIVDESTGLEWGRCAVGMTWNGTTCVGTAFGHYLCHYQFEDVVSGPVTNNRCFLPNAAKYYDNTMYLGNGVAHPLYSDAGFACTIYNAGGHNDWRMPYMHELESIRTCLETTPNSFPLTSLPFSLSGIVSYASGAGCDSDPSNSSIAKIDATLFPNTPPTKFWSSESNIEYGSSSHAYRHWYGVDFSSGELFAATGSASNPSIGIIRCVRNSTSD
jgi:hypothetical protein